MAVKIDLQDGVGFVGRRPVHDNAFRQPFVVDDETAAAIDPVKTGVEEARRILQGRPFGEGHLDDVLVSLACTDQSVVRPHRHRSPLPLLDDVGIGFLDEGPEPAEHLAPPVA